VPIAARPDTTVDVKIYEDTRHIIAVGSLNMAVGTDRVLLIDGCRRSVCAGIDGTCYCSLVDSRRARSRALSGGASTATVTVNRVYNFATSPNASVPVASMINGGVGGTGAQVSSSEITDLSASTTVTTTGSAETSEVDEAFASPQKLRQELALRLPNVDVTVEELVLYEPPHPPPPPPPSPPVPPTPPSLPRVGTNETTAANSIFDGYSWMYVAGMGFALGTVVILCFCLGALIAMRLARRKRQVVEVKPDVPARGSRARIGVDVTTTATRAHDSSDDEQDSAWRPPRSSAASQPQPPPSITQPSSSLLANILNDPNAVATSMPGFETCSAAPRRTASGRMMVGGQSSLVSSVSTGPLLRQDTTEFVSRPSSRQSLRSSASSASLGAARAAPQLYRQDSGVCTHGDISAGTMQKPSRPAPKLQAAANVMKLTKEMGRLATVDKEAEGRWTASQGQ